MLEIRSKPRVQSYKNICHAADAAPALPLEEPCHSSHLLQSALSKLPILLSTCLARLPSVAYATASYKSFSVSPLLSYLLASWEIFHKPLSGVARVRAKALFPRHKSLRQLKASISNFFLFLSYFTAIYC